MYVGTEGMVWYQIRIGELPKPGLVHVADHNIGMSGISSREDDKEGAA